MLVDFPRWAIVLMNVIAAAAIYGIAEFFKFSGWPFALGWGLGFIACYVLYSCWRVDDKNEGYERFPEEGRQKRLERDRAIDPRI